MTTWIPGLDENRAGWTRPGIFGELGDRKNADRVVGAAICGFARWFSSVRVFGADRLHVESRRRRVYVANHTSHADFVLLWASLPRALRERTRPVAAADYWERGVVRQYLARSVFRSVLVSRRKVDRRHDPLAEMLRAVDAGASLILFPEGTRGDGKQLQEFRCGVYHLLRARPELQIVPVWLEGLNRALPRGRAVPLPLPCAVAFGEAMAFDVGQEKHRFLEELRASVERLGEQCRLWMQAS